MLQETAAFWDMLP